MKTKNQGGCAGALSPRRSPSGCARRRRPTCKPASTGAGISAAGCGDQCGGVLGSAAKAARRIRAVCAVTGLLGAWAWSSGGTFCLGVGFYAWAWVFTRGRGVYTLYVLIFTRGRGVRVVGVGSLSACQHASTTHTQHASTVNNKHIQRINPARQHG